MDDFLKTLQSLETTATPLVNAIKGKPDSTSAAAPNPVAAQKQAQAAAAPAMSNMPAWLKWTLIGTGAAAVIGLVVWLANR